MPRGPTVATCDHATPPDRPARDGGRASPCSSAPRWPSRSGTFLPARPSLPDRIAAHGRLAGSLGEGPGTPDLLNLELRRRRPSPTPCWRSTAAAADPRVAGLVVQLDATTHGFAATQELRDAVGRFRAGGKFAVAHADSFGELSSGNEGYYLATAFEEIDLQPVGLVGLTGLVAQVPLARDLLASLGIAARGVAPRGVQDGPGQPDRQRALDTRIASMLTESSTCWKASWSVASLEGRKLDPALVPSADRRRTVYR